MIFLRISVESFQIETKFTVGQVDQIGWTLLCGLQHIIKMLILSFRVSILIGTKQVHDINVPAIPERDL